MTIDWALVVETVKALAWPIVAAFALFLFRRPLVELVAQIIRRARKVSVFEVSLELATLPEMRPSWSVGDTDVRQLTSSQIFDSATQTIFQQLLEPTQADYAIVNLGSGNKWLTSRLFIFALVLGEVRGLRAFVFLESSAGARRRFAGVATTSNVRRSLGIRYPWLEAAFVRALNRVYPAPPLETPSTSMFPNVTPPISAGNSGSVSYLVRSFVEALQRTTIPPTDEKNSYLQVSTAPPMWERAHWIDGERLERDLAGVLDYEWIEESPDTPRTLVSEGVIRRPAPFVALVDSDKRFRGLVDRHALLGQVSMRRTGVADKADDAGS